MSPIERVARAIVSWAFEKTQPDRGDVFSWIDDHAAEIAKAALLALSTPEAISEGMVQAGADALYAEYKKHPNWNDAKDVVEGLNEAAIFKAMIAAAVQPETEGR